MSASLRKILLVLVVTVVGVAAGLLAHSLTAKPSPAHAPPSTAHTARTAPSGSYAYTFGDVVVTGCVADGGAIDVHLTITNRDSIPHKYGVHVYAQYDAPATYFTPTVAAGQTAPQTVPIVLQQRGGNVGCAVGAVAVLG